MQFGTPNRIGLYHTQPCLRVNETLKKNVVSQEEVLPPLPPPPASCHCLSLPRLWFCLSLGLAGLVSNDVL